MIIKDAKSIAKDALQKSERLRAEVFRLDAILEYVAMMDDIEIPEEDERQEGMTDE